jgi:HSP20 family protein
MANLARFNPVSDAFDDLFGGFLMRPVRMEGTQEVQIKLDVKEDDKSYTIHAEMPGVSKDDIHVSIDGNLVSITAEVKNEKEVREGEKILRGERYYGKVSRSFKLGQEIDENTSVAKFTDGVLELTLAKKVTIKAKRLTIC